MHSNLRSEALVSYVLIEKRVTGCLTFTPSPSNLHARNLYSIGDPAAFVRRMTPVSFTKKTRVPVTLNVAGLVVTVYWLALTKAYV